MRRKAIKILIFVLIISTISTFTNGESLLAYQNKIFEHEKMYKQIMAGSGLFFGFNLLQSGSKIDFQENLQDILRVEGTFIKNNKSQAEIYLKLMDNEINASSIFAIIDNNSLYLDSENISEKPIFIQESWHKILFSFFFDSIFISESYDNFSFWLNTALNNEMLIDMFSEKNFKEIDFWLQDFAEELPDNIFVDNDILFHVNFTIPPEKIYEKTKELTEDIIEEKNFMEFFFNTLIKENTASNDLKALDSSNDSLVTYNTLKNILIKSLDDIISGINIEGDIQIERKYKDLTKILETNIYLPLSKDTMGVSSIYMKFIENKFKLISISDDIKNLTFSINTINLGEDKYSINGEFHFDYGSKDNYIASKFNLDLSFDRFFDEDNKNNDKYQLKVDFHPIPFKYENLSLEMEKTSNELGKNILEGPLSLSGDIHLNSKNSNSSAVSAEIALTLDYENMFYIMDIDGVTKAPWEINQITFDNENVYFIEDINIFKSKLTKTFK